MSEPFLGSPRVKPSLLEPALVTIAVGLMFAFVGIEALRASNACLASPACAPYASGFDVSGFWTLFAVGMALVVVGSLVLLHHYRVASKVRP
jgi:hypothetical protein